MKKYFPTVLSLFLLVGFFACKVGDDDGQIVRDQYTFDQQYALTNVKKSYAPGDIIFMEYSLADKTMTDLTTGQPLRVGNATLYPTLDLVGPLDGSLEGEARFSFSRQAGEVIEGQADFATDGYLKFNIGCPASTSYDLKISLQFSEPGGYLLLLDQGAASPFHTFPFTANDDCDEVSANFISDEADIGNMQFFFDVADTNRDVFDDHVAELEAQGQDISSEDFATMLDEKRAFFVLVE